MWWWQLYKNLIAEMARERITRKTICELLGCSTSTLSYKLARTRSDFTVTEMKLIYDTNFKDKVEKVDFYYLCKFEQI